MVSSQIGMLKRATLLSLVVLGLSPQALLAGPVVDIDRHQILGTVTTNINGDRAYFSLGNGRAIQIALEKSGSKSIELIDFGSSEKQC